jgi:voltage-gated potassium channel
VVNHRLARWQDRTDEPLVVAAVVFLAGYAWPILDPGLPGGLTTACRCVDVIIWVVFAVDLAVRLWLTEHRWRYLLSNWLDVIALALPMLRPLRVLRAVLALSVLGRRSGTFTRGRVVVSVVGAVAVVGFVASLAVLDAERRNPQANIKTFGDATWWALSTVATVGYGDRYPTTGPGRAVAAALMVTGIAMLGVITAALASWFVERIAEVRAAEQTTEHTIATLTAEVQALRRELHDAGHLREDQSR